MRVLITGATGFVGQNLLPMLIKECPDIEILTLNRHVEKAERLFPYERCHHISMEARGGICDFAPEVVIHLAAMSTARNDDEVVDALLDSNIKFGVWLLQTLKACPSLRLFINTGSFAEYRCGAMELNDAYLYAATKTAFRSFLRYYADLCGYHYINVIPYTIYGGKMTIKRLVDYIWESQSSGQPVDMTEGEQILDFTYIDDLCSFYVFCLKHLERLCSLKQGEDYHIGTGQGNTPRDVARIIERITGRPCHINWGGRPYRDRDTMFAVAPVAKNIEQLGWRAKINLEDGLRMMNIERDHG